MGSADGNIPALNIVLGGPSLALVFTTPPTEISGNPADAFAFQLNLDLSREAARIEATNAVFQRSAWQDMAARSSDLSEFRARGGKMIVPHGVSDPVFSIRDTLAWYGEVQHRNHRQAAGFVRVFPVPGMNHCAGGPATDTFDAFAALRDWVEKHQAPERIVASAGDTSPWPHRTRPLCPYPKVARYRGQGDIENEGSFECR
jgi:feruloyl esterase